MSIISATTDTDNPANGKGPHSVRNPEVNPDDVSTADVIEANDELAGFTVPNWAHIVEDYDPDTVDGSRMRICAYVEGDEAVVSPRGLVTDAVSVVVRGAEGQVRGSKGAVSKGQGVDIVFRHLDSEDLWQLAPAAAMEVSRRIAAAARMVSRDESSAAFDATQALAIANIVALLESTALTVNTLLEIATALGVRAGDLLRPISTKGN